ncbi:hypothetical protein BRC73_04260 [Halobacteriales archaeon QH_7_66_37]|nr:MAG: hypothetical protein BRC73_04260 [Halobacteriales archaeon QH_7_66_37]
MSSSDPGGRGRRGKVERLIDEYDLDVGPELIDAWTREQNRRSLRNLARYFNRELLRERLDRHGVSSVGMDVETVYRLLRGEESAGSQTRVHRQLDREGVDVESLREEFVSHTAIRTFLRNRSVTRSEDEGDQVAAEATHIQQLQNRTAVVAEDKLETLRSTDRVLIGDFRVLVDVQVFCEDCQRQFDINELLEVRRCSCHSP